MAKNWNEAQINEREFWRTIYVERANDIKTYTPITNEGAIEFARKTLDRHKLDFQYLSEKVVADIGCGPYGVILGIDSQSEVGFEAKPVLIGVDPLMDFYISDIGLLKNKHNIQLHNAQAESIPVENEFCDYVFCVNVIDHVENPEKCVEELHRITKSGCMCGASLHIVTPLFSPLSSILKYVDANHPHHFTFKKAINLLSNYFDKVEVSYMATMLEDQPEFAFKNIFKSSNKVRSIKRWSSTYILRTAYFNCWKN
jgi:ubiquinone/menaquinone biosynthesis C-methylase UbiE